jgi:hypothetical protein
MAKDPFRIRDHVLVFDEVVGDLVTRSERTPSTTRMELDISCGRDPTDTVDLFFPASMRRRLPFHMFVHGVSRAPPSCRLSVGYFSVSLVGSSARSASRNRQ